METFTPYSALLGGALIGLAATLLLALNGRIAGVSGILAGMVPVRGGEDGQWRLLFLAGLVAGAGLHRLVIAPEAAITFAAPLPILIAGGLLVGLGTRIGGGCTSGHGVCGMARLSRRSLVATLTFMATAMITVFVTQHAIGG